MIDKPKYWRLWQLVIALALVLFIKAGCESRPRVENPGALSYVDLQTGDKFEFTRDAMIVGNPSYSPKSNQPVTKIFDDVIGNEA